MLHGQLPLASGNIFDVYQGVWVPETVINRTFRTIEAQFKKDGDSVPTLLYAIWADFATGCYLTLQPECEVYLQQEIGLKGD